MQKIKTMKAVIHTDEAPEPIGPYSHAIQVGDTLYISGQIAIDPVEGELIITSIEEETNQVLQNVGAILRAADMEYDDVVKCTIYVRALEDYDQINMVYGRYFSDEDGPARELVEVSALPKDVRIEISAIAIKTT